MVARTSFVRQPTDLPAAPDAEDPFQSVMVEELLQTSPGPPDRVTLEEAVKAMLRRVYPFSLFALDMRERLNQPLIVDVLIYLTKFGEVEQTGRGRYALKPLPAATNVRPAAPPSGAPSMRARIMALLEWEPAGLTRQEIERALPTSKDLRNTLQGMRRMGRLIRREKGRYALTPQAGGSA